jgi:hypothetical protein
MDIETELPDGSPKAAHSRRDAPGRNCKYRVIAAADIDPASYDPQLDVTPTRRARPGIRPSGLVLRPMFDGRADLRAERNEGT